MFTKFGRHPAGAPTYPVVYDPGTILLVAGSLFSAFGAIQQGQAAERQGKFQAGILRQQATRERQQSAADEADFRRRQSVVLSRRRAALGASGVDQATGSPLLVAEDFAGETELNALRIRAGGETRATRAEQQANLQLFAGRAKRRQGFVRGGALLVSGAGRAFERFK